MAQSRYSKLWAMAGTLGMTRDNVHDMCDGLTGKSSLTEMTDAEIIIVTQELYRRQQSAGVRPPRPAQPRKGNPVADAQRGKIYALSYTLGWDGDIKRINGVVRRVCGIDHLRWCSPEQCRKVIEAMRAMIKREEAQTDGSRERAGIPGG